MDEELGKMPIEIKPEHTSRAMAYKLWMKAPNPMVTFFKTLDVTNLVKISRKKHLKFNMLLQYKNLAVNTIVKNKDGEVNSCDLLFSDNLKVFNRYYLKHTANLAEKCTDRDLSDSCMVIGTSAIIDTEIDGAHAGRFLANLQNEIEKLKV